MVLDTGRPTSAVAEENDFLHKGRVCEFEYKDIFDAQDRVLKFDENASVNFSVYNIFNEYVTTKSGRYEILIADGVKYRLGFNVNF